MFHGVQGEYRWLETSAHEIYDVLQVCPAVAAKKNVVITAFDSGPPLLTENEIQRGWQFSGRSMHIPVGDNVSAIPFEIFNEWYIFDSSAPLIDMKVFAKYEWFTLGPAQAIYSRSGNAFDLKRMQRWFWQEIEQIRPESYLSRSNKLKFVTRNPEYFNQVLRGLSSLDKLRRKLSQTPA